MKIKILKINKIMLAIFFLSIIFFSGYVFYFYNLNQENIDSYQMTILRRSLGREVAALAGKQVLVHYEAWVKRKDGTLKKIDSSYENKQPFEFIVGAGQVVPGWDKGILGMKVGDIRRFQLPPHLAYGEFGIPGLVEPKSTLVFQVELLKLIK